MNFASLRVGTLTHICQSLEQGFACVSEPTASSGQTMLRKHYPPTNGVILMVSTERPNSDSSNAIGTVTRGVDSAASGAHRAIDRASDAARPAVDSLAAGAHNAVNSLGNAATSAANAIDHKGTQLHDAQIRLTENTRHMVRDNPLAAIGVAVAAGFVLSWMMKAR